VPAAKKCGVDCMMTSVYVGQVGIARSYGWRAGRLEERRRRQVISVRTNVEPESTDGTRIRPTLARWSLADMPRSRKVPGLHPDVPTVVDCRAPYGSPTRVPLHYQI
jgi:hypothetical protein